ncbi:hypothetical protein [Vitreoscilla sp. C1]|uniref:hypothetical protein n=1 Tax=Vitreoscilla sp. (strain C1) TaxID=96942 RepID=UPI00148ECC09|nr:hypothetical protein [Vitreoscilla sp. C1]
MPRDIKLKKHRQTIAQEWSAFLLLRLLLGLQQALSVRVNKGENMALFRSTRKHHEVTRMSEGKHNCYIRLIAGLPTPPATEKQKQTAARRIQASINATYNERTAD